MGEVFRARDTRLDRTVAIRVLPSELVNAPGRRVERFRHEARAIARITHPNICTLHDVGEDGAAIFLVMEYVEGATLARRLEDGRCRCLSPCAPPSRSPTRWTTRIVTASAPRSETQQYHADSRRREASGLWPGQVEGTRRRGDGRCDQERPDRRRHIVGNVPDMAPEQIEGHEVDARTDLFSFGIVLYEMVCGRRPFAGDSRASLMAAIVAAEPPALSSLKPQVPASLERLIARCLAKDPDDRWQTARDLAAELRGSRKAVRAPQSHRRRRLARCRSARLFGARSAALR